MPDSPSDRRKRKKTERDRERREDEAKDDHDQPVRKRNRTNEDRRDDQYRQSARRSRTNEEKNADQENGSRKSRTDEEKKNDQDQPVSKKTKNDPDAENLLTRTGGAYIPPARLRAMQAQITDKSSTAYQRISWEALKKSINGLINKVNVSNITNIVAELFQENIVRGRGLLARSVISAQSASPTFTHVYAALVAIINTKFPQTGELILKRLIIQFRKGFRRNDKKLCLSSVSFIAHLVNQQVAHEIVALEILTLLLENPTDDSVEVAVGFLKEVGSKLTEVSPRGIVAIFERLRSVLHEGVIDKRVQYMVEVMFATRKDGFKDHVAVIEELDLVEEEDQFTHMITLDDAVSGEELLNVFRNDPDFMTNEEKYKQLKKEILDEDSDEGSGSGSSSGSDSSDSDEEDEESEQMIIDQTETNMIALRRTIYLTIQSSLDFEECAHKMLKMELKPGQEVELCNMILDCCAQMRTYEKFFGLLAQRFCMIDKKYVEPFQQMFIDQYSVIHRLETNKLRNVGKFFSHLLHTDSISWEVLQHIKLNEDDTTSSSRIFIKILFQDLSEYMGLPKLNQRLKDPTLQIFFEGLLPRDNPRNCRFAINFFTSIGLGGLTDELRAHLKNMPKQIMQEKVASESSSSSASSSSSSSSSDSSSSDSSDDSSSESEEENSRKRKPEKKKKLPSKSKRSRTRGEKEINVRNKHHKSKDQPHPEEQRNSKHKSGRRNRRSEERIDHRQRSKSDSDDEVRVERGHKKHKVVDSYGNSSSESRRVKNRESHKPSPKVDTRKDKYSKGRVNGDKERRRRMSVSGSNSSDDDSDDGDEAEYDQRERSRYEDMETDRRPESRRGGRRPDDARHSSRESGRREDRRLGTGREPVPYGRRGESSRCDYETQNKDHRDNRRQARQEELSDDEHYRRQRYQHQSEEVRRTPASRERPRSRQEASRYNSDHEGSRERPSSRSEPSRYDSDQERDSRRRPYRDDGVSSTRLPERHKYQERTDDNRHYSGRNYHNGEETIRVSPSQGDNMITRQQDHRRERNHQEQHKQRNSDGSESESDSSSEEEYARRRAEERSRGQGHLGERPQERYENGVSTDSSDDETESHRRNSDRKHIRNRDSDRHRQRMVQTVKHQESSSNSSDDSDHSRNHRNNKHDHRDEQRQQKATSSSDSDSSESSDNDDSDDGKTVSNDRKTIRSQIQKVQLNSDSDSSRKSRNEKYIQENQQEETSSSSESEKSDDQEEQNYNHQYRTGEPDREKHRAIQREEERDYQRRRDYDNRERNYDPREHRDIREDRREYRDIREDRRYYRDNRDNRREYKDNRDDRREYRDSRDDRREYRDNRDYDRRSSRRTEYY